jgi:ABC-type multidrug transport system permease subunit
VPALWWGQVRHANRSFWRTPVAAFFTLVFPLSFLVILLGVVGNPTLDDRSGIRLAQFLAPVFAVYGVAMASFASFAIGVATDRESGVLKRIRGTPLSPRLYLAGRVGSATWVSLIAVVLLLGVGVVVYEVEVLGRTWVALVVTLALGIACFATLGLAVVAVVPTASGVNAVTTGLLIPLAFISDIFGFGELPTWLERLGWVFPLKHLANAVADDLNPYLSGSGWYADHLLVMAAWTVGGLLVAARYFRWEPRRGTSLGRHGTTGAAVPAGAAAGAVGAVGAVTVNRAPAASALLWGQVRHANRMTLRDAGAVFFSVVFPVLLLVFFGIANEGSRFLGVDLEQYTTPVFAVYGIAVAAYVNLPEAVTQSRERGVLKRLRGSPLPPWAYIGGRIGSAFFVAAVITAVTLLAGIAFFGVRISLGRAPVFVLVLLVGTACCAALGLMVAGLVGSTRTVTAVTLGTLLPLSFVSGIFLLSDELPTLLNVIGWTFPLRHFAVAAFQATGPAAIDWGDLGVHLAVLLAWTVGAAAVAWRFFRWEPRAAG